MSMAQREIYKTLKMVSEHCTQNVPLSIQTIKEICQLLEGKARKLTLEEVQQWMHTPSKEKDPIFIVPDERFGNPFWITEEDDVSDFHKKVLIGDYVCWTGRPAGG